MEKARIITPKKSNDLKRKLPTNISVKRLAVVVFPILIVILAVIFLSGNATDWNLKLLSNGPDFLKIYAAKRLGSSGHTKAVPPLIETLGDENVKVKLAAIEALGELGDLSALEPMGDIFREVIEDDFIDTDDELLISTTLVSMLRILGQNFEITSNVANLPSVGYGFSGIIEDSFYYVEKYMGRSYHHDDPEIMKITKSMRESLVSALGDKDPDVRFVALTYLGELDDSDPEILKLLDDENDCIRLYAALILKDSGGDRAFDVLLEFLDYDDTEVRMVVIRSLGRMENDRVVDVLLGLLDDDNVKIREYAISALGRQGNEKATEALIMLLEDPNIDVRVAAINALWELGKHDTALEAAEVLYNEGVFDSYRSSYDLEYEIEHALKEKQAEEKFLDRTHIAPMALYGEWVKDWILQGGSVECGWQYKHQSMGTMYLLSDGAIITPLHGASSVSLIAPKGTTFTVEGLGHNAVYYWDESGNAQSKGAFPGIGVTPDLKSYLEGLNISRINEVLEGCD